MTQDPRENAPPESEAEAEAESEPVVETEIEIEVEETDAEPSTSSLAGSGEALTGRSRRRGVVGEHWWAHRWCDLLTDTERPDRLHRGRVLARTGNVFGFRIEVGALHGEVRQSRAELHEPRVTLAPWNPIEMAAALDEIASRARYGAALLAGTLDARLEEALAARGVELFPRRFTDLETSCTCAENEPPCPHIAALIYLYAERIDRNPFLALRLRGIRREPLLEECRRRRRTAGILPEEDETPDAHLEHESNPGEERPRPPYFGDFEQIAAIDPRPLAEQVGTPILDELGLPPRVEPDSFSALAVIEAYTLAQRAIARVFRHDND